MKAVCHETHGNLYSFFDTRTSYGGFSIDEQKDRLIAYCKAHAWIVANIYVDGGYSGSNLNRPGIQKLIGEVGSFDVVLVYKLDRLSRSQRDTLYRKGEKTSDFSRGMNHRNQ